jgi:hypothetical protein
MIEDRGDKSNEALPAPHCVLGKSGPATEHSLCASGDASGGHVMDGSYVGADFRGAKLFGRRLAGDFQKANFEGACLPFCVLSGCFDGARGLGPAMQNCEIEASASFKHSELTGCDNVFQNADQLEGAQIQWLDTAAVRLEKTIQVRGESYQLHIPAQMLKGIVLKGDLFGLSNSDLHHLHVTVLSGRGPMYDLTDSGLEVHGGKVPPQTEPQYRRKTEGTLSLCLNAPGVTFRSIHHKRGSIRLEGNFDNACFKDCEINILNLARGSFMSMDLMGATIGNIQLHMDEVELDDIKFPEGLEMVRFFWATKKRGNTFCTSRDNAVHVLDAWNSVGKCDALATYVYNRVRASSPKQDARLRKIMRSRGQTLDGVAGGQLLPWNDLSLLAGLIARRNQLTARGAPAKYSGAPSTSQSAIMAGGDPVTKPSRLGPEAPRIVRKP